MQFRILKDPFSNKKFLSQIWLSYLLDDGHFGYITKSEKKKKRKKTLQTTWANFISHSHTSVHCSLWQTWRTEQHLRVLARTHKSRLTVIRTLKIIAMTGLIDSCKTSSACSVDRCRKCWLMPIQCLLEGIQRPSGIILCEGGQRKGSNDFSLCGTLTPLTNRVCFSKVGKPDCTSSHIQYKNVLRSYQGWYARSNQKS